MALQNAFPLRTLVVMVAAWEKVVVGDRASPGKDIYLQGTCIPCVLDDVLSL